MYGGGYGMGGMGMGMGGYGMGGMGMGMGGMGMMNQQQQVDPNDPAQQAAMEEQQRIQQQQAEFRQNIQGTISK